MTRVQQYVLNSYPKTDEELYHYVRAVWGWTIPNTPVCPNHTTPFRAFADAYFARHPIVIWKASRGFGGKTNTLGLLGQSEASFLSAQVSILGGSGAQSTRVYEAGVEAWQSPHAPKQLLQATNRYITRFNNDAWIETLMASQRSVRGTHPQRLRMDEIDEMDLEILEASLGTVMDGRRGKQRGIVSQIVMSSTHQYPDKTMSAMLGRARENNWPVYEWCISRGAIITTSRGGVKIEDVHPGDRVWTRSGWREVQHLTLMGVKPTVEVCLASGRVLACTADHRIAVPGGWAQAGSLTAGSVVLTQADPTVTTPIGTLVGVGGVVGVPLGAGRLGGPPVVTPVDGGVDHPQMVGVDAVAHPAGVVDLLARDVMAKQAHDGTVHHALAPRLAVDDAVAIGTPDGTGPQPAPSLAFGSAIEQVVDVSHGAIVPVYDIGVHGEHEFVANGVIVHNCYRECMNPVDGWLTQKEVDTKRTVVPKAMWDAEYDLQEPSFEGRAIDGSAVDYAFSEALGKTDKDYWRDKDHNANNLMHVTGIDWAKERDLTVLATFDTQDEDVWRCVQWECFNRIPWPAQVAKAEAQYRRYGGTLAHDATGIGNVLADLFDADLRRRNKGRFYDITLNGAVRATIFTDYITAIEDGRIAYPMIERAYNEHRYATMDDLFGRGHPPDSVVAGAIAWHVRDSLRRGGLQVPISMTRPVNPVDLSQLTG